MAHGCTADYVELEQDDDDASNAVQLAAIADMPVDVEGMPVEGMVAEEMLRMLSGCSSTRRPVHRRRRPTGFSPSSPSTWTRTAMRIA